MHAKILTVGNKPKADITKIIHEYLGRLPRNISVDFRYIKHAKGDRASSIQSESEIILSKISDKDYVILLDETGEQISSPQLAQKLFSSTRDVTFVIGGAYGVNDKVMSRANFVWSLGKLVFPHQLVRLILAEQIYRAHTISINHPYHH